MNSCRQWLPLWVVLVAAVVALLQVELAYAADPPPQPTCTDATVTKRDFAFVYDSSVAESPNYNAVGTS